MARRGFDTLRYGPLKPVGLTDPNTGKEPYAVVQLRQDNAEGTVFNLVGFQTHLKFGEQKRVFSMIPALKNAEFVRYGVMHRNTFLKSPKLLDRYYADRRNPLVAFAGQMTGVEGYVESTASGFLAAVAMAAKVKGIKSFLLTGNRHGICEKYADVSICVPEKETYKIQELHLPVYHAFCAAVESNFWELTC
jgi:methylenetetrahydrofolate--tRNA-(uracil-5-)-methyltransferase